MGLIYLKWLLLMRSRSGLLVANVNASYEGVNSVDAIIAIINNQVLLLGIHLITFCYI